MHGGYANVHGGNARQWPILRSSRSVVQSGKLGMQPITPSLRFIPGSTSSSWKDICVLGRKINEGCDLEFIDPVKGFDGTLVASIVQSEIHENVIKWSNTLVGYVLVNKPFFNHLKACVA